MPYDRSLTDEKPSLVRKTEKKKRPDGPPSAKTLKDWEKLREKLKKKLDPAEEK